MHLQQQTARVVQADLGAVAVTPGRQKLLPAFDHQRVVIGSGEVMGQCLGCDQRLPWFEAELAGGGVDGLQHAALWRAGEQGQWRGGIVAVAQNAVHGQLRQQNAGPEHRHACCQALAGSAWPGARPPRHLMTRSCAGWASMVRRSAAGDGLFASCSDR